MLTHQDRSNFALLETMSVEDRQIVGACLTQVQAVLLVHDRGAPNDDRAAALEAAIGRYLREAAPRSVA